MKKETIGSLFDLLKISLRKMLTVRVMLPLAILVLLTVNIIPNAILIAAKGISPFFDKENVSIASMIGGIGALILVFIASILYSLFLALIYLAAPAYFVSTEKHDVKRDVKNIGLLIKKRWAKITLTMLSISLLAVIAVGIAALLSFISPYLAILAGFIAFIYITVRFYVAMYPAIYDGFGAAKSLEASTKIMDGIKAKTSAFIGLLMLIYLVCAVVLFLPFGAYVYFNISPEYLLFILDKPISEDFTDSITMLDYCFREILHFAGHFIYYSLTLIFSGVPALLYLKRRDLAVSTN